MNSQVRVTGSADVCEYISSVAVTMDAESVRWCEILAFDAVLTLSCAIPHYRGRKAVLAWNRHFGWFLGVHGLTQGNVVIIDGLGLGRLPEPTRCADRLVELIADLSQGGPPASRRRSAPRIVRTRPAPCAPRAR